MIVLRDVCVKYGEFEALHHLHMQVNAGEFFTLLGPSGCGKTTTLRTLAGFIAPSQGSIWVGGQDVTRTPVEKRGMGMVFQQHALFPALNVYDNIAFGLRIKRLSKQEIDRRVRAMADKLSLPEDTLSKRITQLSGGQQQRVAIARALVTQPGILCLDEPLSSLDAKLRSQLRLELKRMQRETGLTLLYVTHDQEEALTLSDRMAVFNQGRIEQIGTPNQVYNQPSTAFVCSFVGETNKLTADTAAALGLNPRQQHFIRPERVHIAPAASGSRVSLPGIVQDVICCGASIRYTVLTAGQTLTAITNNDGSAHPAAGESITLGLDLQDVMHYDDTNKK